MSNLFNIGKEYQQLMETLDHELINTGEISDETTAALEIKKEEMGEKMSNYRWVLSMLDSHKDMAQTEINRIKGFVARTESKKVALQKALLFALLNYGEEQTNGVRKLEFDTIKLSTRTSKSIDIQEEEKLPDSVCVHTVTVTGDDIKSLRQVLTDLGLEYVEESKPSKKMIKELLEKGVAVPGAEQVSSTSLQIK